MELPAADPLAVHENAEVWQYTENIFNLKDPLIGEQHFVEIKVVVDFLRNVDHTRFNSLGIFDVFEWLGCIFGFQSSSVENQREHLVLLLVNAQLKLKLAPPFDDHLDIRAVDAVLNKLLKNYFSWRSYVEIDTSISFERMATLPKVLSMALYLLIWGEAANLRFMPECLCYIYHHMLLELHAYLGLPRGANIETNDTFLRKIVTPLYAIVQREALKNSNGKLSHSSWLNYDDLNEYFWSNDCFTLGWPIPENCEEIAMKKNNFVETWTMWHLFRSFHRLWIFVTLGLQVLIMIARHDSLSGENIIHEIAITFIPRVVIGLIKVIIDVLLDLRGNLRRKSMLRKGLQIMANVIWALILVTLYQQIKTTPCRYFAAVTVQLLPDIFGEGLCFQR